MKRLAIPVLLAAALPALAQGTAPANLPSAAALMNVPSSDLRIKNAMSPDSVKNPFEGDRNAVVQGEQLFNAMNCSGCHAALGGGGMGPPLSDGQWIYGGEPAQIYLTIAHGRPNGMPAWGGVLPPQAIWSLVAYVRTLGDKAAELQQHPAQQVKAQAEK